MDGEMVREMKNKRRNIDERMVRGERDERMEGE